MIKKSSFLVFIVLLNSCAIIFNNHTSKINIHSDVDSMRICLKSDTTKWYQLPTWIEVNRSRYDLPIITEHHNIRKTVNIDEKLSNTYIFGNIFSPYFLGYIVDLASSKTFKYPNYILLLNNDKKKSYTSILKPEKGRVNFKISFPYGINFAGRNNLIQKYTYKFMGAGVGIDYYFKNNFYFNSDIFFLGDITGNEYSYIYSTKNIINSSVSTFDFQLGSEYKKLKYEGGIQFNQTVCEIEYSKSNTFIEMEKSYLTQNKFGFALSAYYNLYNNINIGLSTYPSIMVFEDNVLSGNFSNIVFLEFLFNFEAFSPRLKTKPQKLRKFNFFK